VRVSDNGDGTLTILALTTQVVQFDGRTVGACF
jgi:hypothetical protein